MSKSNNQQDPKYSEELLEKLKKQAQEFYEHQVEDNESHIVELKQTEDWDSLVVKSPIPIILDCYATWCEPCKQLTPFLEQSALKAAGKWKLVKIDIDKHPQIASGLQEQLQKVPTVILVVNGNAMDGFTGIPDKNKLDQFFQTLETYVAKKSQQQNEEDKFTELQEKLEVKDVKSINEILKKLNSDKKTSAKNAAILKAYQSWAFALESNITNAQELLKEIEEKYSLDLKASEQIQILVKGCKEYILELQTARNSNTELQNMIAELEKNPQNLDLRFEVVQYCEKNELYEDAIKHCLNIITINRNWNEKKAQQFLLKMFEKLGSSNALVIQGRKKLGALLY